MSRGNLVIIAAVVLFAALGGYMVLASRHTPQARTFDLTVTGNAISPSGDLHANQGDTLTFNLTGDRAEEIHLHGYDKMFPLQPGRPVSMTFTADRSGTFEIEIEATRTHLTNLVVRP